MGKGGGDGWGYLCVDKQWGITDESRGGKVALLAEIGAAPEPPATPTPPAGGSL